VQPKLKESLARGSDALDLASQTYFSLPVQPVSKRIDFHSQERGRDLQIDGCSRNYTVCYMCVCVVARTGGGGREHTVQAIDKVCCLTTPQIHSSFDEIRDSPNLL
jgi:hypothetical protein